MFLGWHRAVRLLLGGTSFSPFFRVRWCAAGILVFSPAKTEDSTIVTPTVVGHFRQDKHPMLVSHDDLSTVCHNENADSRGTQPGRRIMRYFAGFRGILLCVFAVAALAEDEPTAPTE